MSPSSGYLLLMALQQQLLQIIKDYQRSSATNISEHLSWILLTRVPD